MVGGQQRSQQQKNMGFLFKEKLQGELFPHISLMKRIMKSPAAEFPLCSFQKEHFSTTETLKISLCSMDLKRKDWLDFFCCFFFLTANKKQTYKSVSAKNRLNVVQR